MHKGFIADIYHEVFLANTELEVFYGIPLFSKILCSDRSEIFRGFSGITPKAISRTTICPGVLGVPFGISLTDDLGDYQAIFLEFFSKYFLKFPGEISEGIVVNREILRVIPGRSIEESESNSGREYQEN